MTRNEAIERLEAILAAARTLPEGTRIIDMHLDPTFTDHPALHVGEFQRDAPLRARMDMNWVRNWYHVAGVVIFWLTSEPVLPEKGGDDVSPSTARAD